MGKYYRSFANSINFFAYTVGVLGFLLISFYLKHYESILLILLLSVITCFFCLPTIKETPFFYFQKGNLKEMYNSLNHILKVNYHRDTI